MRGYTCSIARVGSPTSWQSFRIASEAIVAIAEEIVARDPATVPSKTGLRAAQTPETFNGKVAATARIVEQGERREEREESVDRGQEDPDGSEIEKGGRE